ncbi:MAG: hypothetical protein JEZ08_04715 [Clostridiales bacterium]|nr:hypothetical protein [Clostridiales bacterium]
MNKKIELYHYGDCGAFDDYNPFKVYAGESIPEVLYLIGRKKPYTLTVDDIVIKLNCDKELLKEHLEIMKSLLMIDEIDGYYSTKFTIIVEDDLEAINDFSKDVSDRLSDSIITKQEELKALCTNLSCYNDFETNELLYHVIGCMILDGSAIDELSSYDYFKSSKEQVDHRDYILFGFEKSDLVDEFSEGILCSCNNYRTDLLSFVSFGDAAGNRNDFFRFERQVIKQINQMDSSKNTKQSYLNLLQNHHNETGLKCAHLIMRMINGEVHENEYTSDDDLYLEYLQSFNYIKKKDRKYHITVPVFLKRDMSVIDAIHDLVMKEVLLNLSESFSKAHERLDISAVKHGVDIKEILNEMWHQIFGHVNETLVTKELFKRPDCFEGEGRYLKCIEVL